MERMYTARGVRRRQAVAVCGLLGAVVLLASAIGRFSSDRGWQDSGADVASAAQVTPAAPDAQAAVPEGAPSTSGLDPELQRRFDAAAAAAADEGVALAITSGWRSAEDQQLLVDAAMERYGSAEEARRWALPPESSAHVAGLAIDVGGTEGAYWLTEHGWEYGLCRVYENEIWHFEPTVDPGGTCPPMQPDSSGGWG